MGWNQTDTATLVVFCCAMAVFTGTIGIPALNYCNEIVYSTIREVRPNGYYNCFYDVSYLVGQVHYNRTVGGGCPSSLFNSTQINYLTLCYSHLKPAKCEVAPDRYRTFEGAVGLTCISAFMLFVLLCTCCYSCCPSFTFVRKGSVVQQVQITPV